MRRLVTELLIIAPGFTFESVMGFTWKELKTYHDRAVKTFKTMRGIDG